MGPGHPLLAEVLSAATWSEWVLEEIESEGNHNIQMQHWDSMKLLYSLVLSFSPARAFHLLYLGSNFSLPDTLLAHSYSQWQSPLHVYQPVQLRILDHIEFLMTLEAKLCPKKHCQTSIPGQQRMAEVFRTVMDWVIYLTSCNGTASGLGYNPL